MKNMNDKIIQHNQNVYEIFREKIAQDDWSWYSAVYHFRCVRCGGYVTRMNFMYFNEDYEQVLCYNCQ